MKTTSKKGKIQAGTASLQRLQRGKVKYGIQKKPKLRAPLNKESLDYGQ